MERPTTNRATIGEDRATVPTIWTNAVGAVRLAATWLAQICYAKILRAIENGRSALEIELLTRQHVLDPVNDVRLALNSKLARQRLKIAAG